MQCTLHQTLNNKKIICPNSSDYCLMLTFLYSTCRTTILLIMVVTRYNFKVLVLQYFYLNLLYLLHLLYVHLSIYTASILKLKYSVHAIKFT